MPGQDFKAAITAVAFSPKTESHLLAVGDAQGTINLWDITNPKEPSHQTLEKKHKDDITALEFSPNGHLLASASLDKTVNIWDVPVTRDSVDPTWRRTFTEHRNRVMALAFSPENHWLVSADVDGAMYRWDPTNESVQSIPLKGHKDVVTDLAFRRDGHTLISASRDGTIRLWDYTAESPKPSTFLRRDSFSAMALTKDDSNRLVSANQGERIIRVWKLGKLTTIDPLQWWDHKCSVVAVAFIPTPDRLSLVSADKDNSAHIWSLTEPFPIGFGGAGSQEREAGAEPQGGSSVCTVQTLGTPTINPAISPDGSTLATVAENADKDYRVRLWNLTDSKRLPRFLTGSAPITALAFSPKDHTLAGADKNRQVLLWNLDDPTAAPHLLSGHETPVTILAFSPDGHTLASADNSGQVFLWDLNNLSAAPRHFRPHSDAVTAVAFSLDGHTLASASRDKTMQLWNRDDGSEVHTFRALEGTVKAIAFSPDGKTLASGGADKFVRLWDLEHPEQDARELHGHRDSVLSLAFSRDGRLLASGAVDHAVFVWHMQSKELRELACQSAKRNLGPEEWKKYFKDEKYHETCPGNRP